VRVWTSRWGRGVEALARRWTSWPGGRGRWRSRWTPPTTSRCGHGGAGQPAARRVDILVTRRGAGQAGSAPPGPQITDDALRAQLETKCSGYLRARALAPGMVQRGWGGSSTSAVNARGPLASAGAQRLGGRDDQNLADELGPAGSTSPWCTRLHRHRAHPETLAGSPRSAVSAEQAAAEVAKGSASPAGHRRRVARCRVPGSPRSVAITGTRCRPAVASAADLLLTAFPPPNAGRAPTPVAGTSTRRPWLLRGVTG